MGTFICKKQWEKGENMTLEITVLFGFIAASIGISTYFGNIKRIARESGKMDASMKVDIKYISRGIDDIREQQKEQIDLINDVHTRLSIAEGHIEAVQRRVDELEQERRNGG